MVFLIYNIFMRVLGYDWKKGKYKQEVIKLELLSVLKGEWLFCTLRVGSWLLANFIGFSTRFGNRWWINRTHAIDGWGNFWSLAYYLAENHFQKSFWNPFCCEALLSSLLIPLLSMSKDLNININIFTFIKDFLFLNRYISENIHRDEQLCELVTFKAFKVGLSCL